MVHLRPLPGAPLYDPILCPLEKTIDIALEEAATLENAGVDGLQIENIWDYPYLKGEKIGHETTAAMAMIATKVMEHTHLPLGINCHLNGGFQALAVANAVGARWIRVFEWVNAYVSHAGIIEGIGSELARYRKSLNAERVKFFCDVNVKHGSHFMVSDRSVPEQARDAETEGAEVLIITGFETGKAPSPEKVKQVAEHIDIPLLIGSGTTKENVSQLLSVADGAIVGSYFKHDNNWKNPLDVETIREFMGIISQFREEGHA